MKKGKETMTVEMNFCGQHWVNDRNKFRATMRRWGVRYETVSGDSGFIRLFSNDLKISSNMTDDIDEITILLSGRKKTVVKHSEVTIDVFMFRMQS